MAPIPTELRTPAILTAASRRRILLVRHGSGRGPHIRLAAIRPASYQPLLDDFARRYPELRDAIDVWHTGTPLPDLAGTSAIVFLLSDPLRELYPDCYRDAQELTAEALHRGIRVVNPPAALSNTIKSRQAELLLQAGVPAARHAQFESFDGYRDQIGRIQFPAIVRADLLHAQSRMIFCGTREEALRLEREHIPLPGSIAEFVDTREDFRRADPDSEYARYFHKKRAFVFGRHVVNNHVFFGPDPIVGVKSSTFGHYRSLNPVYRWIQNSRCREHVKLDYEFFRQGEDHRDTLLKVADVLGLEFLAVDYSSRADGSIVVWEANPHFSLYPWPFEILPRQRKLRERHRRFHDTIQLFFRELQEGIA